MSAIIGANYLLLMDDIARTITMGEIPIGILTSLVGTPFFAVLLWRNKVGCHDLRDKVSCLRLTRMTEPSSRT